MTLTSWILPKQASFMALLFRKNVDPKRGNQGTLLPAALEVVPLPKPLCGLEMQLSKRNVTQWPHWHPTGQCLGSINASSAHVIPPHGVPHHPMRDHFLPHKFISALCNLHPSWAANHFSMHPTILCSLQHSSSSKGDPRDSHGPQHFPSHSQSPCPIHQSL